MSDNNKIEARKEAIKNWLKNPYNLTLVAILILALAVRIYFFTKTIGQTYWWDEAEYMAGAKHWALNVPYDINPQRPPLFQLLSAFLLMIGFGESAVKFILVLLPSVVLVYMTFLIGKELFNEKIGLIASALSAFMWSFLFWTSRFQPDFLSVSLQLLSVLFLWRLFKEPSKKIAIYAGIFTALAFYFKISALLIPLSALAYGFFKEEFALFKNKHYWTSFISFVVAMIPFMIWQYISFGNPLAFAPSYIGGTGIGQGWAFGWMTFSYYLSFTKPLFLILFLIGIALAIFHLGIRYDILLKDKKARQDGSIFAIIILAVVTLFYIFYIRGTIEDRWVFIMVPFIFYFASAGLMKVFDFLKPYNKTLATLLILVCVALFAYQHINHNSSLTENKLTSYLPIKESSLLIKEHTNPDESILSVSLTQATAYSERKVYTYADMDQQNFTNLINEKRPSYIVVSILEPHHPTWIIQQAQGQNGVSGIIMEYFNSTIAIQNNQVVLYDVKPSIDKGDYRFDLVYPQNQQLNGAFVYKISYRN